MTDARWASFRSRYDETRRRAVGRAPVVALVFESGRRWFGANGAVLAGHLAFRVFLFLVPALLLVTAGLGLASDSVDLRTEAVGRLGINGALATTIADAGRQASESKARLGLGALAALLVATWGLLGAFRLVFAAVWGVPAKSERSTIGLLPRFLGAVGLFVAFGVVRQAISTSGAVLSAAALLGSMACNTGLYLGLAWLLPRRPTTWRDLLPGAAFTGVTISLLNVGGAWYFSSKLEHAAELYGVVGIVVTVLGYLFLLGQAVVFGAVVNTVWFDRHELMEAATAAVKDARGDDS